MFELYSYYRSSAAYRVRIALALKGLDFSLVPVHLVRNGGEQHAPAYRKLNPEELVPTLVDDGTVLTQSLAILEYLEETHPSPALLPADAAGRARVRGLSLAVACDIHPVNNSRILKYLENEFGVGKEARDTWYRHWVERGFRAIEAHLEKEHGDGFCHGNTPTMADCCLIPQVFNARRFDVDMAPYPLIQAIDKHCTALPAFRVARPDAQPDAPSPS